MKEHFLSLSNYNAWANERLYDAVGRLPDEEVAREREGAFFNSILGTLNHVLVADRLWLARIEGEPAPALQLDSLLEEEFPALRDARRREDRRIIDVCDGLREDALFRDLRYSTVAGDPMTTRLDRVLTHLFNHQTHHRGQAHALILEAGAEPPPLDYLYYLRALG